MQIKKMTQLALFIALASVLSIVEGMLPIPVPLPGVKLGLANIVSLSLLSTMGLFEVIIITVLRCIISAIYSGSPISLLLSLSGGIVSVLVMKWLTTYDFGLIAISITGALCHNLAQLSVYAVFLRDTAIFSYFPVLSISSVISGIFVGAASYYLLRFLLRLPLKTIP